MFEETGQRSRQSVLLTYGAAMLAVAAAAALRFSLGDVLKTQPFPTFFVAIAFIALVSGPGPVLFATALSEAVVAYFFMPPIGSILVMQPGDQIRALTFAAIGCALAALTAVARRARKKALDAEVNLVEERSRQYAESALRASEIFVRGVLDSLPHEIAVISQSGEILAVNASWTSFAKDNNADLSAVSVGANYLEATRAAAAFGESYAVAALEGLLALLRGENSTFTLEYPCHAPDRDRWFVMHADCANCAPAALVISHTDITELKRTENRLREATTKLCAADERKNQFLATLAHELRNPLAPISNAIYVLRYDAESKLKTTRDATLLAMIGRQVGHLVRLVDDLLEVSRITRGKIELKNEAIDLREVLRHAIETAQLAIERGGHTLSVRLPDTPLMTWGDSVRLVQVFTNLLNNAAKYTVRGGSIFVVAEALGDEAQVTVRDSGVGIPGEMLTQVFDLFTQVDHTLGRADGGLGIGLALVKSLVELHGGKVEARSEGLGHGSAFVVRLPMLRDAAPGRIECAAPSDLRSTRRVLVIDDDRDVADSLAMLIETFGASVRVARTGSAGLEALADFKPDLIFLDLGMPEMDGFETARRIAATPDARGAKLIALTGWSRDQVHERARAAGFQGHMTKPVSVEALQELLE